MSPALPLEEAQQRLLAMAAPLGAESVPTAACLGRYLAAALTARRTQPAADLSAMDGYAVHEAREGFWRLVGESAAGRPYPIRLAPGEAVRISTGALMPAGAHAVLLQEEAIREQSHIAAIQGAEPSSRHIRRRGFDFIEGDIVLHPGTRIGPAQLALAMMAGHGAAALRVGPRPRVAVIDSGDELAPAEAWTWEDHELPASNGVMIAALAAPFSSSVERLGPVPDRMDALVEMLTRAEQADVIVTSGGASVGDHDLVRPALEAWGATIDFWRVAMKPGKPLLIARKGEKIVLGLPGNPVSSYVTAFLFLLPLLRRLAGARAPYPDSLNLPLGGDLPAVGPRIEFVRARLLDGALVPLGSQDSSALGALAASDALIRREIGAPAARAGEQVSAYLLETGRMA
jgi:molybdopterin molybdotransferase